jgi:hypothetical protein
MCGGGIVVFNATFNNISVISIMAVYNGFATSQIDYILPFRDKSFVKHVKVLQRECTDTSTHDLVIGHIFLS